MRRSPLVLLFCGLSASLLPAAGQETRLASQRGTVNVVELGAVGDGFTDNTLFFREAMALAASEGGGVVQIPAGKFLIREHLNVPSSVTLEGVWQMPVHGIPYEGGTTLLAVHGKGNESAAPFITLNTSSMVKGLTIYYPEQVKTNPPHPYPWTVVGIGDNCTVVNVTMINPYKAVDFGSNFCGRHFINGLYAQALYRGLYIDQCYDVGRIQNIHFGPFWEPAAEGPLFDFTQQNGIAFVIARTDGQMGYNLSQIFYGIGFHFLNTGWGAGSGVFTHVHSLGTPLAMKFDAVQNNSGWSIANGTFASTIEVNQSNTGPIRFLGCQFSGAGQTAHQARLRGTGHTLFDGCRFNGWDNSVAGTACILAESGGVSVTRNKFFTTRENHLKVELRPNVPSAIIGANRMEGGAQILNLTLPLMSDVQIGMNSAR